MQFAGNDYRISPRFERELDPREVRQIKDDIQERERIQREYLKLPEHPYGE